MNKQTQTKIFLIIILVILAIYLVITLKSKKEIPVNNQITTKVNPYLNSKIDVKTYQSTDKTWGYDITIDGQLYVHQPTIPAIAGNTGFKTELDAQKVAKLVEDKIRKNDLPPSVTLEELKSLGIN